MSSIDTLKDRGRRLTWRARAYAKNLARALRGDWVVPIAPPRAGDLRMCELTNPEKWDDPSWMKVHEQLRTYSVDEHCFSRSRELAYRKGWEWTQALWGLERLGMITPGARALGVGAGHEPVIFYLADRIREVVATDLYGNETWSQKDGKEGSSEFLDDMAKYCPRKFDASHVRALRMDGTHLELEDASFDFVWSLSSIEHFGGHAAAARSVREMGRVVRPGGIVAVATEFVLTPGALHPDYFDRDAFEQYVIRASPKLTPVEAMDYTLPPLEYLLDPIMVRLGNDADRVRHHVVLNDGEVQWTSAMVFLRRLE